MCKALWISHTSIPLVPASPNYFPPANHSDVKPLSDDYYVSGDEDLVEEEDPYHSPRFLGQGGFGSVDEVYKRSDALQVRFARKRYRQPNIHTSQRQKILDELRKEANILRNISFRHVVELVKCYTWKEQFCIIIAPVADTNLGEFLSNLDFIAIGAERDKAREVALQWPCCLIRAIDYLHEMRIRHRDIKPSNILIKGGTIFLIDFGISKIVAEDDTTGSTGPVGPHTYTYSAPEILSDNDVRRGLATDIYALGCVFLELCTALIAPPGSRADSANHRLRRTATLAYARNETAILQWILHIWAHWSLLVRGKLTDDEYARFGGSLPDLLFIMLDPGPKKRITARQLVAMIITPRLYYFDSLNITGCIACRVTNGFEDTNLRLHSEFKDTDDLKYAKNPKHALEMLPAPDWESTKREWLRSHVLWK
ncbi:kinase-like protein [Zopfia rhizophila CBS 207.26]|uniref:Kinase-like protein n=1 Tax=Zopfia rhizophila CBS 207.26 TaxID=1314779 RepID=A0A6A6DHJ1_9PEZI|nr:kinase-like protein [Zopfia rhizophila CBS 207.26]